MTTISQIETRALTFELPKDFFKQSSLLKIEKSNKFTIKQEFIEGAITQEFNENGTYLIYNKNSYRVKSAHNVWQYEEDIFFFLSEFNRLKVNEDILIEVKNGYVRICQ